MKAFFGKIWLSTKNFFLKAWKWAVGHKVASIAIAAVLVAGTASAIVLPIVLHEHTYAIEWSMDATNHWHDANCGHEGEKSDVAAHVFDNACDTDCNVCGTTREVEPHVYDNACDTVCNVCEAEREVEPHVYDNDCDTVCNVCEAEREVEPHVYDNDCDTTCNVCNATRVITHSHATVWTVGETTHWYACSVCGDKKDETAHVYNQQVETDTYLKDAATATTKAVYYKSCVCGAKGTETFEKNKLPINLQVSDISKTYDGTAVVEPTVTFDSNGAESFAYYKGDEKLTERPTNAGTYKVVVTVDETETHVSDSVEQEFTIAKKPITGINLEKEYNGTTQFAHQITAVNGLVTGDACVINVFVSQKDATENATITQVVAGNPNYSIAVADCTLKITPKKLTMASGTTKIVSSKTYDGTVYSGTNNFASTHPYVLGIISGDVLSIDFSTNSKDVGAYNGNVTSANGNYDFSEIVFEYQITPKTLNEVTYEFTYNGSDYQQVVLTSANHSGILGNDQVTLEVCFVNACVGSAVDTSSPEMAPCFNDDNYVLGTYSFSIIKKMVTSLKTTTLTAEYNGTNQLVAAVTIDDVDATLTFEATKDDAPIKAVGEYTGVNISNLSLGDNFMLVGLRDVQYTVNIVPKKLTALDIRATIDAYNTTTITLLPKDGIIGVEEVKLVIGHNYPSIQASQVFYLQASMGQLHGDKYEVGAYLIGADKNNYELVAYEDENGNSIYGTLTIVTELTVGTSYEVSDRGVSAGETDYFCVEISATGFYFFKDEIQEQEDSSWATITVIDEKGEVVTPNAGDKYRFVAGRTIYITTVAVNTLDFDTVTLTIVQVV